MFLNSSDWLVRMRPVSTILFRAAEGTKSRANNLISDHFCYIDIDKQFFFGFYAAYTKTIICYNVGESSGYLLPIRLIIVR